MEGIKILNDDLKWQILEKQVAAANLHNLDELMNTMTDDVQVHLLISGRTLKGQKEVREFYANSYDKDPKIKIEITNKLISDKLVVIEEKIIDSAMREYIGHKTLVVNEVANGKIKQFWIWV